MESLGIRQQRQVYLVTYSRADATICPSRQHFADAVVHTFHTNTTANVLHWVVSQEQHSEPTDDQLDRPFHFHMAIKLSTKARWLKVRDALAKQFRMNVNFSSVHNTYYSAFKYVTKEDLEPMMSRNHPDLQDPPKTEKAIGGKRRKAKKQAGSSKEKRRRRENKLSVYDVTQLIQSKGIRSRLELVALAVEQDKEGKISLAEFIANRGSKVVDEALSMAKEFAEAQEKLARSKKSRVQLLTEAYDGPCATNCEGRWLPSALSLIQSNGILLSDFCQAVYSAIELGRGKYRNIFIHGPANSGKTFILSPLKLIYRAFCNPATGTFAWVGAEEAEVVMLNDFRWKPSIIAWADMLQLLEGDVVHLPTPKNFSKQDVEFTSDTPFFATADAPMVLVKAASIDQANTEMMRVRWRFFHFWKQIAPQDQLRLVPCSRCFARFVVDNKP